MMTTFYSPEVSLTKWAHLLKKNDFASTDLNIKYLWDVLDRQICCTLQPMT